MTFIAIASETAGEVAEHASEGGSFPAFDPWHFPSQILFLAIIFSALYLILSRAILPKLGNTIERRGDTIAGDLDEAARLDEQAVEAQQALELRLAEARNKARATADKARAEIDDEIGRETRKVDKLMAEKVEAAEVRITKLRSDAMANVEGIATDTTRAITERFGVRTSASDAGKAVSAALAKGA